MSPRFCTLTLLALGALGCAHPGLGSGPEPESAYARPPEISQEAWVNATAAYQHALIRGLTTRPIITVIDYTLPSTSPRLWVVDLGTGMVLRNEYVAHAIRSGAIWARQFSNVSGSRRSSLGTFLTAGTFQGVRGLSLRLVGLEPGINDHALGRGIVIHGTPGVSAVRARQGKMGRTEGCPAVSRESARQLISLIEDGTVVFIWYPDPKFLQVSEYLDRNQLVGRVPGLN